jgi:Carboxypeptidase regulatory-like domain
MLVVFLLVAGGLHAQPAGQATVALQGYYLGGAGQPFTNTSGLAVSASQFLPGAGLLSTSLEGYGSNGFRSGNVFGSLQGYAMWGWHWDFTGGDFRFSANLVENPFTNVYLPEISARGARIVMKRSNRNYQFFVGEESVLGGPRIPYRTLLPQLVLGGAMQQKVGKRWEFGLRFLRLTTSPEVFESVNPYALPGHDFTSSNSLTFQSTYTFIKGPDTKGLKLYTEASYGTVSRLTPSAVPAKPLSFLAGPSWETDHFSFKANYTREGTTYLPLLGIFAGDRKGPYAEGHYRPFKWADLYGTASGYSNNLEGNPDVPTFHSKGYSAGTSLLLPWKFNVSGSLSSIRLTQHDPTLDKDQPSDNRQVNITLGRSLGRHSVRVSVIDLKMSTNNQLQRQRFLEAGDTFSWKWFVVGGSVRQQSSRSSENRDTRFYRGSAQFNHKRFSVYSNVEIGNDLVNKSVFSTNAFNTTVVGMSAPLPGGWVLHGEAFRIKLNTALNPENVFLFGNALNVNTQLAAFNQWSVYFTISKQFRWGKELPSGSSLSQYAAARVPLVGTVQGMVIEQSLEGPRAAASVSIRIDSSRSVLTDASGHYLLTEVPEGPHEIALNMEELPTDYEPGTQPKVQTVVFPRGMIRADFRVFRLTNLSGRVAGPAGVPIENVIVRLASTSRYTTPDQDGRFAFDNLREGEYEISVDEKTVPEGYVLASPASVRVGASSAHPPAPIVFEIKLKPIQEKPVREIILNKKGQQ